MEEKLPEGWELAKIGDIADVIGGSTPSRTEKRYFGGDIVWLTPTEIPKESVNRVTTSKEKLTIEGFNSSGVRWIPEGSVLLTSRASIGYVAIAGTSLTTNQGFASFILPNEINPFYFGWWLRAQKERLEDVAGGTTFKEISKLTLKELFAPIAPANEQNNIVSVIEQQFTRLDSAVASLKSAKARIKQYRASLLKSAVEGELTREWRAEQHPVSETGEQLLARILQERRVRWEEEQLRKMGEKGLVPKDDTWKEKYEEPQEPDVENLPELPEGWCWVTLEQCAQRITDGTHQPPQFVETGIPFIFVKHVVKGQISFEGTKYISEETYQVLNSRCAVDVGDILYSAVGSYGVAVPVLTSRPFSFQRHIAHIKPSRTLNLKYLVACLNSSVGIEQAHKVARGVAQKTVTLTDLARFMIPLPSLAEQKQIVSEAEELITSIEQLEKTTDASLKRAERERQSILQEAFAGRLVPQDPNDEPASILLERIQEERKKREEAEKVLKAGRKGSSMEAAKKRRAKKVAAGEAGVGLYEVLVEAGEPLRPEEVFRLVGLKTEDQPESVEAFYVELRADVADDLVGVTRPDTTTVLLEALDSSLEEEEALVYTGQVEDAEEEGELAVQLQEEDEKVSSEWPTLWDELDNE